MKKVLFVVDFKSQRPLILDIEKWFFKKLEIVFTDEDKACSVVSSQQDLKAVVFCCWQPNGATLDTVENVFRTFCGLAIACNENSLVQKMLLAVRCQYACQPLDLPSLIERLLQVS